MTEHERAEQELTELEQAILRVEREWWRIAPTRDQAIYRLTALSPQKYYLILSSLLDKPYFWRADPVLVDRLRRLRDKKLVERDQQTWDEQS